MFDWLFRYANPARFMSLSGTLLPWLWGAAVLSLLAGLYMGFSAPPDYQQGRTVLITCELPQAEYARDQILAYGPDWRLQRSKGSMSAVVEPAT